MPYQLSGGRAGVIYTVLGGQGSLQGTEIGLAGLKHSSPSAPLIPQAQQTW